MGLFDFFIGHNISLMDANAIQTAVTSGILGAQNDYADEMDARIAYALANKSEKKAGRDYARANAEISKFYGWNLHDPLGNFDRLTEDQRHTAKNIIHKLSAEKIIDECNRDRILKGLIHK